MGEIGDFSIRSALVHDELPLCFFIILFCDDDFEVRYRIETIMMYQIQVLSLAQSTTIRMNMEG